MPAGDCEKAFADAAALDGIQFERAGAAWITRRGHFDLPDRAADARDVLAAIFAALGGDTEAQRRKTNTELRGDYFHAATRTFVEVDELQHFSSARLRTLEMYPSDLIVGFDLGQYRELCLVNSDRADRQFAHRSAVGFGPGGRQRQRAYNDALRDLATPAMGFPPVIRVPAVDRDGELAYQRARVSVKHLFG